jgi:hypothetical protein
MKRLLLAAIVAMAASGPAWALSSTGTGVGGNPSATITSNSTVPADQTVMGLKKAAVARLCLNGDIYRAMPEVCGQYLPPRAPGYPAPPPVPTRCAQAEASEEQPYTGSDIWLSRAFAVDEN